MTLEGPIVWAHRVAFNSFLYAARGGRWLTKISWEVKVTVCHPKTNPLGLSSGTGDARLISGETAPLCLPPKHRASRGHGRSKEVAVAIVRALL